MKLTKAKVSIREKRIGIDRRKFSYSLHIPERRSGMDRRGVK